MNDQSRDLGQSQKPEAEARRKVVVAMRCVGGERKDWNIPGEHRLRCGAGRGTAEAQVFG